MHEGDYDIAQYKKWLEDATPDPAFKLQIGESCRMRNEHVDKLPATGRFKLIYTRVDETTYRWLDNEGTAGVDPGPLEFYEKHWEKV